MKLDIWSLLDAGGVFQYGRYEIRNSNGLLHRDDGPAVIYSNGMRYWYRNGERHRDDGPAIICPNGSCHWYRNGQLQQEDK